MQELSNITSEANKGFLLLKREGVYLEEIGEIKGIASLDLKFMKINYSKTEAEFEIIENSYTIDRRIPPTLNNYLEKNDLLVTNFEYYSHMFLWSGGPCFKGKIYKIKKKTNPSKQQKLY